MQYLVLFCVLSVASASYYNSASNNNNYYQQQPQQHHHVPVIHNGVPIETPEVQQAKAEHYAALAKAQSQSQHNDREYYHRQSPKPIQEQTVYYKPASQYVQQNHYVPQDTPEVAAAKAEHLAMFAQAKSFASDDGDNGDYHGEAYYEKKSPLATYSSGPQNNQFNHVDSRYTSVQNQQNNHYRYRRSLHFGHQHQHIPIITKEGVPLETPEVQHAKYQHLLAHQQEQAKHHGWVQEPSYHHQSVVNSVNYAVSHDNHHQGWNSYHGAQLLGHQSGYEHYGHSPVQLGVNGVPIDTPEVQIARAQHLAAHAQEAAKHSGWSQNSYDGDYYSH